MASDPLETRLDAIRQNDAVEMRAVLLAFLDRDGRISDGDWQGLVHTQDDVAGAQEALRGAIAAWELKHGRRVPEPGMSDDGPRDMDDLIRLT